MEVKVLLFGAEAIAAGRGDVRVQVEGACTCAALKQELARTVPSLAGMISGARVAVNCEFAPLEQMIKDGGTRWR